LSYLVLVSNRIKVILCFRAADRDARAVIVTGIPYPSVRDPKVQLKKKFLDNLKFGQKHATALSGAEW
jgi:regulator of telomere elongation helicase 1